MQYIFIVLHHVVMNVNEIVYHLNMIVLVDTSVFVLQQKLKALDKSIRLQI